MKYIKRVIFAWLFSIISLVILPVPAFANTSEITEVSEVSEKDTVLLERDKCYAAYVESVFYNNGTISPFALGDKRARVRLVGDEALAYDAMVPIIKEIAAGSRTSTVITLGEGNTDVQIKFQEAKDEFKTSEVLKALMSDFPYEMYWYDYYSGTRVTTTTGSGRFIRIKLEMTVALEYRGSDTYITDVKKTAIAVRSAANAQAICEKYKDCTEYEKLRGFWQEIIDLVDFAEDREIPEVDINPWQLIHVFDGDPQTKVVCEGYSKAFQYLCDMSGLVCYPTEGKLNGGDHEWNTVTLAGKNYLVDVLNSEAAYAGSDGCLFLAGAVGSVTDGYTITNSKGTKMTYVYREDTIALWGKDVLTLSNRSYSICQHTDEVVVTAPTCTEEGYTTHTCTKCKSVYCDTFTAPLGHNYEDYVCQNCRHTLDRSCGENLIWSFEKDTGTLTISGSGAMNGYKKLSDDSAASHPWGNIAHLIKKVIIREGVTEIGKLAFYKCFNITEVTIPDSVTVISDNAFDACTGLQNIILPSGLTKIGSTAFFGCSSLKEIVIPEGVTEIGQFTFYGCSALESIILPESLISIGNAAFYECKSLRTIVIPQSLTAVGDYTFAYCHNLESVIFPDYVTEIGYCAFYECKSLKTVTIPASVSSLDVYAFGNCSSLYRIVFLGDVPVMDSSAFKNVTAEAYYPVDNTTWEDEKLQSYGGKITWKSYDPENPFTDVAEGEYYYEAVQWAVENGITQGTTFTTFSPSGKCSRDQAVTFLWRARGSAEPINDNHSFIDVDRYSFYYKAMLWAVENEVTNGFDNTHFAPAAMCNRGQIVTFLWRACGRPEPDSYEHPFADIDTDEFYYKAVLWAVENGITTGLDRNHFGPDEVCERGQIVTFLYRTFA